MTVVVMSNNCQVHYQGCTRDRSCRCQLIISQHNERLIKFAQLSFGRQAYIRVATSVQLNEAEHGSVVPDCKKSVRKKIISEGYGECIPFGANVVIKQRGFILPQYQSFRDTQVPCQISFKIGRKSVISGLDRGVENMKKGEIALLSCGPEWAYGIVGRKPDIPPNCTVQFEIEVLDWDKWTKATEDGGVLKLVMVEGKGPHRPNEFAECKILYRGWSECGYEFVNSTELMLNLGEDPAVLLGLEKAIANMFQGERSQFRVRADYAFGNEGKAEWHIEPGEDLHFEITLMDFQKGAETWQMNMEQRLQYMERKKGVGNKFFKTCQYVRASKQYESALKVFQFDSHLTPEQQQHNRRIKVNCHSNLASCVFMSKVPFPQHFKSKEPPKSKEELIISHCANALALDPDHIKSLIATARARIALKDDELAVAALTHALKLDSSNEEAQKLMKMVSARLHSANKKHKALFSGIFDRVRLEEEAHVRGVRDETPAGDYALDVDKALTCLSDLKNVIEKQKLLLEREEREMEY